MRHLIAFLLALASLPALAAEPTPCGAQATGKRADNGVEWTGADPLLRVGADGVWQLCPEQPPAPAPCLATSGPSEPRAWTSGGLSCVALRPDRTLLPGELAAWRVDEGPVRGELVEECPAAGGERRRWAASCEPVRACLGGPWSFDTQGAVHQVKPAHVAVGQRLPAVSPAGRTVYVECAADGRLQLAQQCVPPVVPVVTDFGGWVTTRNAVGQRVRRQCVLGGVLR